MRCANSHRATALRTALGCAALALGAGAPSGTAAAQPRSIDPAANARATIAVRPVVDVQGSHVRLGDVAFLTTRNLPLLRQLMALPIGAAPRPGVPVVVDRETIARWVDARSGGQDIRWTGATEVRIERAAQQLSGETVVAAARSALERWLAERSDRAQVQTLSMARDLVLPAGTAALRVRPLPSHALPARRMLVWVDAWVDDRFVRTTAVRFEVGAWAPAAVASGRMDRKAPLDPIALHGAIETREVDLTTIAHGKPLPANDQGVVALAGTKRLRRPLRAGEVLTEAKLEAAPAVERGQSAHLRSRSGNVSIRSRVDVLQDGREGQMVRVRVPGASGDVLARVTGPGELEVQP